MSLCYELLIDILRVSIRRDAGPLTAGQSYSLTCTITLDGITGTPTIEWLDPNNNPVSNSSSVTVENIVMVNNSAYDRTLAFSSLRTSHGGQYTCQAILGQVSAVASSELLVQSVYAKSVKFYVHCDFQFNLFPIVPQPTVSITPNRTGVLYAGTPLTLTCSIQLNPAVDTTVMVTRMWRGPRSQVVRNTSLVTVSCLVEQSDNLFETSIVFNPLRTSSGGSYNCGATVTPDPQSQFVIMSTASSDTHTITVQGEYCQWGIILDTFAYHSLQSFYL